MEALRAFVFGLAIAVPIGPIAILLMRTGLNHGLRTALPAALGVALADLTYAVIALSAGAALHALLRDHERALLLTFSALLTVLGGWLFAAALRPRAAIDEPRLTPTRAASPIRLYLLTLANPLTILLFAGYSGQITVASGAASVFSAALWLFLGSLLVQLAYAAAGAVLRRWIISAAQMRTVNALSGAAVVFFGLFGFWRAF